MPNPQALDDAPLEFIRKKGYRIVGHLGQGAFGSVWKVGKDDELLAAKIVELPEQEELRQSVQTEVMLHTQLKHPNIVALKHFWCTTNALILLMEVVEGGTLEQRLKDLHAQEMNVQEDQVWDLVKDLGQALACLHDHAIIHRDVKPANVLARAGGGYLLADFGLAKMLDVRRAAHTLCGTPAYMAPEILDGRPYDTSVDIWAFGCTLFEVLTGKVPFLRPDGRHDMAALKAGDFQLGDEHSHGLQHLIGLMLKPDPRQRPTANDILQDPCVHVRTLVEENARLAIALNRSQEESRGFQDRLAAESQELLRTRAGIAELRQSSVLGFQRHARLEEIRAPPSEATGSSGGSLVDRLRRILTTKDLGRFTRGKLLTLMTTSELESLGIQGRSPEAQGKKLTKLLTALRDEEGFLTFTDGAWSIK